MKHKKTASAKKPFAGLFAKRTVPKPRVKALPKKTAPKPKPKPKPFAMLNIFKRKKSDGHFKYIHDTQGGQHGYTGITSHKKTFGKDNIPLTNNPDPKNKNEKSYARNEYKKAPISDFKVDPKTANWRLHPEDKSLFKKIKLRHTSKRNKK